jgi:hypothetical protein
MERTMPTPPPASLLGFLASVPGPRSAGGRRHNRTARRAAVRCAVLCGGRGLQPLAQGVHDQDIALVHALGFTRTPPRWGAVRKSLMALDPTAFGEAVAAWAEATCAGLPPEPRGDGGLEPAARDGKAVRGSLGRHEGAIPPLPVMAQRSGWALRQAEVGDQANDHQAAPGLLRGLVLEGRGVTGGAMFCRRDLCQQVVADGGHSFVVAKENQPGLRHDIRDAFDRAAAPAVSPAPAAAHRAAVHRAPHPGHARRPGRVPAAAGHRPAE